ncbi:MULTISPECIES: bifunctional hydroxymethylpyrimidine kinase/phosphomethylpyrimidine kinase [Caulobacter]|jgi:pyridoxine kinase|uniref:pyridoxal kinase n=1 Tax=Caulobacter vibrioides OR37 TaxID=1292034 RepID=R0CXC1_CAUVI|nr:MULTISPECIES: bifunctional hydroxymethylpyrimidine kinase/phosphomethylpyrimidine kinase [Caulobacter]ENZ80980.1 Pyridoxal kinase [Caulobacter vibrioides OR37]MBQ1559363.1 bifunctional hydroxymethylpyrimidine kinase/phosphomethylpyrimidine kinase [Caulobacter sp.]
MPLALIISSHVAGSQVGASAQAAALAQFRIESMVTPTVLYGRHPGWGIPGGAPVPIEVFEGMLDGIEANGLFGQVDLVITGYFASAAQVRAAARVIDAVRETPRQGAATRKPVIVVDPTMGDAGKGLYIPSETADEIIADLVPRADVVACNAWELQKLTGADSRDPIAAMKAARLLGKTTLVSSVHRGAEIGAVLADRKEAWLAAHAKSDHSPNGTGDLLTALYAASILEGQTFSYGLARAVGGVAETVTAANIYNSPELPIVMMGARIKQTSPTVRIERLA